VKIQTGKWSYLCCKKNSSWCRTQNVPPWKREILKNMIIFNWKGSYVTEKIRVDRYW